MAELQALYKVQRMGKGSGYHVWIPNSEVTERRQGKAFDTVKSAVRQGIGWVKAEDDGDPEILVAQRRRVTELKVMLDEEKKKLEVLVAQNIGINLTAEDWKEIDEKSPIISELLVSTAVAEHPWLDKYGLPWLMGLAKIRDKDKDGDKDIDVIMSWSPYTIPRP